MNGMAKDNRGKVSGGKSPGGEDPRNRASKHAHNWNGKVEGGNVYCTCGQKMGPA